MPAAEADSAALDVSLLRPLTRQIARAFEEPIYLVEQGLLEPANAAQFATFCTARGPPKLLVSMQRVRAAEGEGEDGDDDDDDDARHLVVSTGEADHLERAVLLAKVRAGVALTTAAAIESDVACTVLSGSLVKSLLATL